MMDQAHQMWERDRRDAARDAEQERFWRFTPLPDRKPAPTCVGCGNAPASDEAYFGADLCADCIEEMETA